MLQYVVRRLLLSVLVVFGVSLVSFGLMFLSGDPASALAGDNWTRAQIDEFRHQMGFDRPWYVQYGEFVAHAVRGNFGTSLRQHRPVFELLMERMPATLELTGSAFLLSLCLSIPIGILSAARRNSVYDRAAMLFALAGQSMPVFWVGTMLILIFAVRLQWLPVAGRGGLDHLILPAIALGLFPVARNARVVRSSMLEVLGADYVRTARAKGLPGSRVLLRHAFKNALLPVVTLFGLDIGYLLSGAVITESIFAWPGVGRLTVDAVLGKDLPLVEAAVVVLAGGFVLINLLVDLLYGVLDPRVRFQ
ncbi:MAG TPA: ABC transporter permease [Thermomicrobiaceae bacterium]|nr:ABC transporter permease [Thermomicrobiaceae bacterium]